MAHLFDLVKKMHDKFDLSYEGNPRTLDKEEYIFRIGAMFEELLEYINAVFDVSDSDMDPDGTAKELREYLMTRDLRDDVHTLEGLENQFDALIDLSVFVNGTSHRQGFNQPLGEKRVMDKNLQKELAGTSENSKRGFSRDLVKPKGWTPPYLKDLVSPYKGIIVLDGPDGTGKTTLAEHIAKTYGGVVIHSTWSEELEQRMDEYLNEQVDKAIKFCDEGQLVIIDRLFASELIYSEAFRNGTKYPDLSKKLYNKLIDARGQTPLYLFCTPINDYSVVQHKEQFAQLVKERPEMYKTMDYVVELFSNYLDLQNTVDFGRFFALEHESSHVMHQHAGIYDRFIDPSMTSVMSTQIKRYLSAVNHNGVEEDTDWED